MRVFGVADDGIDYVHEGPHARGLPPAVVERVDRLRREVVRGERAVPFE
jgi:basic membrane protein A